MTLQQAKQIRDMLSIILAASKDKGMSPDIGISEDYTSRFVVLTLRFPKSPEASK